MYILITPDGKEHPADVPALQQWAQAGSIEPDTLVIDAHTGHRLRAAQLLPLQPFFGAANRMGAAGASEASLVSHTSQSRVPIHQRSATIVLCLILCAPVGLALLWFHPRPSPVGKWIGTVIGVLFTLGMVGASVDREPKSHAAAPPAATTAPEQPKRLSPYEQQAQAHAAKQVELKRQRETEQRGRREREEAARQAALARELEPKWRAVRSFTGSSIKNTESFTISGDEWRISWVTRPGEYGEMNFQIYVYNADGSLKDIAANVIGAGEDSTVIRGSGTYYLQFNSGQPYSVVVEEYR
jgi:hypothetical protein